MYLLSKDILFLLTYQREEKKALITLQSAFVCDHDHDHGDHHQQIVVNNKTPLFKSNTPE